MLLFPLVLAALGQGVPAIPVLHPQAPAAHAAEAEPRKQPAAVEHLGDHALRERLIAAGLVWHDAGDFLVVDAPQGLLAHLAERGVRSTPLQGLLPDEALLLVDVSRKDVQSALKITGRVLYARGNQALVAVPPGLEQYPEELVPGHTCHSGHTTLPRRPVRPARTPTVAGVDIGIPTQALSSADARIVALVAQLSKANIEATVVSLASNFSRNSTVPSYINAARDQIVSQLVALGYSPQLQSFSANHGQNILVEIPGSQRPNEFVILGAHYDSRNSSGSSLSAPGADDNASGSASVLEIARVLRTSGPLERSVRMIWFAGEEYGLLGAEANALITKNAGQQVVGMLNMDMNAYRAPGDVRDVDFATNNTHAGLTAFCNSMGQLYVGNWASTFGTLTAGSSDHAAYHAEGFPAVFPFEDLSQYYSQIHTANDAYPTSTTDFDLALMITRGVLATALTLAEPADLVIDHMALPDTENGVGPYPVQATITSATGGSVGSATLHYSPDGTSWTSVPMSAAGSSFSAAIPALGNPVVVRYYLTALDDQGYGEALPEGADEGAAPFSFLVGKRTPLLATGFEEATDNGWTHAQVLAQDDWQRGTPAGKVGDPLTAFAGTRVWGNDLGPSGWNGSYANNVENWLRAPVVNCSSATLVHLEFRRWLTVEAAPNDLAQVRVNNQVVWQNPSGANTLDNAWVPVMLDISSVAAGVAAVQVEFRLKSNGSMVFGGWNLDEFRLSKVEPGTSGCAQPAVYCSSQLTSSMCLPAVSSTGSPSAGGGFVISASQIEVGQMGIAFYSKTGAANAPLGNGTLCIQVPVIRLAPASSGGSVPCSGSFTTDFSAWIASGNDPALVPGTTVWLQYWFRDPVDPFGFALSNALTATICP